MLSASTPEKQQLMTMYVPIRQVPVSPEQRSTMKEVMDEKSIPKRTASRGRLDLLAFAMEQYESGQ
jgi:hypothetical protein